MVFLPKTSCPIVLHRLSILICLFEQWGKLQRILYISSQISCAWVDLFAAAGLLSAKSDAMSGRTVFHDVGCKNGNEGMMLFFSPKSSFMPLPSTNKNYKRRNKGSRISGLYTWVDYTTSPIARPWLAVDGPIDIDCNVIAAPWTTKTVLAFALSWNTGKKVLIDLISSGGPWHW